MGSYSPSFSSGRASRRFVELIATMWKIGVCFCPCRARRMRTTIARVELRECGERGERRQKRLWRWFVCPRPRNQFQAVNWLDWTKTMSEEQVERLLLDFSPMTESEPVRVIQNVENATQYNNIDPASRPRVRVSMVEVH